MPHLSRAYRTKSRELHTLKELRVYKRIAGLREVNTEHSPDQRKQMLDPLGRAEGTGRESRRNTQASDCIVF